MGTDPMFTEVKRYAAENGISNFEASMRLGVRPWAAPGSAARYANPDKAKLEGKLMTESTDSAPVTPEPFQAPLNGRGLLTVKGPSSKSLDRLSVTRSVSPRGGGVIQIEIAGPKGGKGVSIDLSPAQARDHAARILRAAGEDDIANLIPWNVSQDMRAESDARIVRLADRLRKHDAVLSPIVSKPPSLLKRIVNMVRALKS